MNEEEGNNPSMVIVPALEEDGGKLEEVFGDHSNLNPRGDCGTIKESRLNASNDED